MQRSAPIQRHTPLAKESKSETALIKKEIQALLRELVMRRDGGCILRHVNNYDFLEGGRIGIPPDRRISDVPQCNGYAKDGHLILQADHLLTRANGATYADPRLVVCLCKGHHGWKSVGNNMRKAHYDQIVRKLIEPERVALWEACEKDLHAHRAHRMTYYDWQKEAAYLRTKIEVLSDPAIS